MSLLENNTGLYKTENEIVTRFKNKRVSIKKHKDYDAYTLQSTIIVSKAEYDIKLASPNFNNSFTEEYIKLKWIYLRANRIWISMESLKAIMVMVANLNNIRLFTDE